MPLPVEMVRQIPPTNAIRARGLAKAEAMERKAARAWKEYGQPQRAIEDYDEAIRLAPKLALAYNNRGGAHIQRLRKKLKDDLLNPRLIVTYRGQGKPLWEV